MKKRSPTEKLLIEEISHQGSKLKGSMRGLSLDQLIKLIRENLGLSQAALGRRAGMPQSTISRAEQSHHEITLPTFNKIFSALSCELVLTPVLVESLDDIRRKQARKIADKHVRYLKGTMNLENQEPVAKLIEELRRQHEEELLHGPCRKLWEE